MHRWSRWRHFPDPRRGASLTAPLGPGVYELRNRETNQLVLVGIGRNVAARMCSLYPAPLGATGRNNTRKSNYVRQNINRIDYRTIACPTRADAAAVERDKRAANDYLYPT